MTEEEIKENDTVESIKRNVVTLTKQTLNEYVQLHMVAHDCGSAELFKRAKKQFREMQE